MSPPPEHAARSTAAQAKAATPAAMAAATVTPGLVALRLATACFSIGAALTYAIVLLRSEGVVPLAALASGFVLFHAGGLAALAAGALGRPAGWLAALVTNALPAALFWVAVTSVPAFVARFQ